ncbi:hypothetical protein SAMN05421736_104181 [Evansella caseinilytica]|uniref:Uncharacterized protein n=1 Tax=Evansella caseinilytica TaxID=1503961 RepID=A0A1H3NU35_9BACI|nr:hypothetical protein SAMN05421736_104181 [Evansella caseinilytica]
MVGTEYLTVIAFRRRNGRKQWNEALRFCIENVSRDDKLIASDSNSSSRLLLV